MSAAVIDQVFTIVKSSTALRRVSESHSDQSGELAVRRSQQVRLNVAPPAPGWSWRRMAIPAAAIFVAVAGVGIAQPQKLLHSEPAIAESNRTRILSKPSTWLSPHQPRPPRSSSRRRFALGKSPRSIPASRAIYPPGMWTWELA